MAGIFGYVTLYKFTNGFNAAISLNFDFSRTKFTLYYGQPTPCTGA